MNSLMDSLSAPSEMSEGMDRPDLVIWSLKPKSFKFARVL